jgi:hypothetical protein
MEYLAAFGAFSDSSDSEQGMGQSDIEDCILAMLMDEFSESEGGSSSESEEDYSGPLFDIDQLNQPCRQLFRFRRDEIVDLAERLLPTAEADNGCLPIRNGGKVHKVEAFCVLLRRFAVPDRWSDAPKLFHRHRSTLCNIFMTVLNLIYTEASRVMRLTHAMFTADRLAEYSESIADVTGYINTVIGFIDGTFRRCCRPRLHQRQLYNRYYRGHGLKYQAVVTPDGLGADIDGPIEGRRADITMLRMSNIEDRLRTLPVRAGPFFFSLAWRHNSMFFIRSSIRNNVRSS